MKAAAAKRFEVDNDWEWEINCAADAAARVKRLETTKLNRFELYEELLELMALLEVYWCGLAPERQRETAKEVRDLLRKFEAQKARIQTWAARELRKLPSINLGELEGIF
jgi:hypothetical protein